VSRRVDLLYLLMLATAICPALAWQQGLAWIAEVGDPMIHLFCQAIAAWPTSRGRRSGLVIYLLLLPYAAWDLLTGLLSGTNVPLSQILYVPLIAATAAWGWLAVPDEFFEDDLDS
jgi:hypothetical protein